MDKIKIAKELVKMAKELTAGSDTAGRLLYTRNSSIGMLMSDIDKVREELREQGFDKEADKIWLDAVRSLKDLKKVLKEAHNLR